MCNSDAVRLAKILGSLGISPEGVAGDDGAAFKIAAHRLGWIFTRFAVRDHLESKTEASAQLEWLSKVETAVRELALLLEDPKSPVSADVEATFDATFDGHYGFASLFDLAPAIRSIFQAAGAVAKYRREDRGGQPSIPKTPGWSPTDQLIDALAAWYGPVLNGGKEPTTKLVDGQKGGTFVNFVQVASAAWGRENPPSGSAIAKALTKRRKRSRRPKDAISPSKIQKE